MTSGTPCRLGERRKSRRREIGRGVFGFSGVVCRGRFQRLLERSPFTFASRIEGSGHGNLPDAVSAPRKAEQEGRAFREDGHRLGERRKSRRREIGRGVFGFSEVVRRGRFQRLLERSPFTFASRIEGSGQGGLPHAVSALPRGRMPRMSTSGRRPAKEKRTGGSCFPCSYPPRISTSGRRPAKEKRTGSSCFPCSYPPRMSTSGRRPAKEKRTGGSCFPCR